MSYTISYIIVRFHAGSFWATKEKCIFHRELIFLSFFERILFSFVTLASQGKLHEYILKSSFWRDLHFELLTVMNRIYPLASFFSCYLQQKPKRKKDLCSWVLVLFAKEMYCNFVEFFYPILRIILGN